jgi:hypothetical protein
MERLRPGRDDLGNVVLWSLLAIILGGAAGTALGDFMHLERPVYAALSAVALIVVWNFAVDRQDRPPRR